MGIQQSVFRITNVIIPNASHKIYVTECFLKGIRLHAQFHDNFPKHFNRNEKANNGSSEGKTVQT